MNSRIYFGQGNNIKCCLHSLCLLFTSIIAVTHARVCRSNIDASGTSGVKIEPVAGSLFEIDFKNEFYEKGTIEFEFRTSSKDALLLYMNRRNDKSEIMAIQIFHGYLVYTIRCSQSHATLTIPKIHVNDDKWHKIRYSRENVQAKFELDGKEYHSEYQLSCGGFTSMVFGSVGKADWGRKVITSLEVVYRTAQQFSGCIRNLKVSTENEISPYYVKVTSCV
ncbi:uncharacterized protein LOC106877246 [Octopus bimaculoides]|uniref:Laminin G domain-containing protein n=1 Tax=Octopus bimaculoides TaxID=37653 RepID=A0A0L8GF42_OCTBM|nr:uncharacterized protein LOC106877246 [Octopus bimaculoides]|eukprot:XP_014781593.1 PREDICTED: uncharacterized protein LOC106877246 [Octopus bimaculoides]